MAIHAALMQFDFRCSRSVFQPAQSPREFARHDEIVVHLVERGGIRVVYATGARIEFGPERLMVGWGAMPHRPEWLEKDTTLYTLSLPLAWFLRWQLPGPFTSAVLAGHSQVEADPAEGVHDLHLMRRWAKLLAQPDSESRHIVLLEAEARLWRLARHCQIVRPPALAAHSTKVEQVMHLIARRFAEPLRVPALAAELKLNPDYLSTLFKRETGQGLAHYLTEYRLAHACALLVSTTDKIIDVAYAAGFGSLSQFHTVFQQHRGCTPRRYRLAHRPPEG